MDNIICTTKSLKISVFGVSFVPGYCSAAICFWYKSTSTAGKQQYKSYL